MRIEVKGELTETQSDQWRRFLAGAAHGHPEQDPGYADGWRAQGQDVLFAMGWDGDALKAVALLNIEAGPLGLGRRATAMSGPVCDDADDMRTFLAGLTRHDALKRVGKLTITPYWLADRAAILSEVLDEAGWAAFEDSELRMTGIHDLSGGPDDIAARFNKTARRKLRKARALGLEIDYVTDEATAAEAFEIHNRHFEARTGDTLDRAAFLADFRNLYAGGEHGALFLVRAAGVAGAAGEILGGCVVTRARDTLFLRYSFVDDAAAARHGNVRLAPLVTHEALSWGQARGCLYGDENGYIHGLDESHPLYRVYKYKEDFHPAEVQRLPGRRMVLRPGLETRTAQLEKALDWARARAAALRALFAGRPVGSRAAGSFARTVNKAMKLPLGLAIGGSAGWIVTMVID